MFENPFVPVFGGKPDFFFGRKELLSRFSYALVDRGSEDRALFITGNRGCGKTALLEQFSQMASEAGWQTIDLNAEKALVGFARGLARHDSTTKSVSPEVEVTILGSGGRIGGVSSSKTTVNSVDDIEVLFLEACAEAKKGVFVSVDEIQKMSLQDLSVVCGAFQMASRKGFNIILAVAGLPYAHERVIQYEGCTFMRRAVHVRLGVFTPGETSGAIAEAFSEIKGLTLSDAAHERLVAQSYGHPYFIQLAGYYLVAMANDKAPRGSCTITLDDVEDSFPAILSAYERRSLQPIVEALPGSACEYLTAMARVVQPSRVVRTKDVADALGKTQKAASGAREELLREGLVISTGYGELMFNVPYLQAYMLKTKPKESEVALAQQWGF